MNNKRNLLTLIALVAMVLWVSTSVMAQDDECVPSVTLTTSGVQLQGCDEEELIETAEELQEEAVPEVSDLDVDVWEIRWFSGATRQMRGLGQNPWPSFENVNPALWPEFPNVDNPAANFVAAQGVEYGMAESSFCQNDICDVVVPPNHYRLITADYNLGFDSCEADEEFAGCAIMLLNVGLVSSNFEDVMVDSGFTVFGRYWDGDQLPISINAVLGHAGSNMLNLNSDLNPEGSVNAGGNCSDPDGCERARLTFAILSGNEVLAIGRTFVSQQEAEG